MNKGKISIIMNCYNAEEFIYQSITSVIEQSYKNWELIIWDNQSTDESSKVIKSFKDRRIYYFLAEQHTSLHEARNLALSKISGEFFSFLDCDDYWNNKSKLKLQYEKINKDEMLACVYSKFFIKYHNSLLPTRIVPKKKLYSGFIFNDLINEYYFAIGSGIFRVNKLKDFPNIFDTRRDLISDFDFIMRLSLNNKFDKIDLPLFTYRHRKNSMSNSNLGTTSIQMDEWSQEMLEKNFFNKTQYLKIKNHINHIKVKHIVRSKNLFGLIKFIFFKEYNISLYKILIYYIFKF